MFAMPNRRPPAPIRTAPRQDRRVVRPVPRKIPPQRGGRR